MEPVTHFLTGATLGRSGFNRKTAYATLAMTLAAEAPDIDVIFGFGGPVTGFCHHRGITHTFLGAPFMALAVTGVVWAIAALLRKVGRPAPVLPVHWGWIWFLALIADFSHLLLDFTNNYGLRPFFPFSPHWYAWSIVFIFEPVMFLALVFGLVIPGILGLVEGEMRRRQRGELRGRGWAIAALVVVGLLYGVRNAEHARAELLMRQANAGREEYLRVAAEPHMGDPFTWSTLAETREGYETGTAHTLRDVVDPGVSVAKATVTPAVSAAKGSYLGRVYESWSLWPITEDVGLLQPAGDHRALPPGTHTVLFRDLRFSNMEVPGRSSSDPVLGGLVVVGPDGSILEQWMDGREQRSR